MVIVKCLLYTVKVYKKVIFLSEIIQQSLFPSFQLHDDFFRKMAKLSLKYHQMSCVMRKCKNKDADQLHGNHTADQRPCFHYIDDI